MYGVKFEKLSDSLVRMTTVVLDKEKYNYYSIKDGKIERRLSRAETDKVIKLHDETNRQTDDEID